MARKAESSRDVSNWVEDTSPLLLPCPFSKHDPKKYSNFRDCNLAWPTVHHVQDHLYKHHRPPGYNCHICKEFFADSNALITHLMVETPCTPKPSPTDWISDSQIQRLENKNGVANISEVEKWQRIYRILFPDVVKIPDPHSSYAYDPGPNLYQDRRMIEAASDKLIYPKHSHHKDYLGDDGLILEQNTYISYTDSGYASRIGPNRTASTCQDLNRAMEKSQTQNNVHEDYANLICKIDASTQSSKIRSYPTEIAQSFVVSICDDIYHKIVNVLDKHALRRIQKTTPNLIKDFAVKLGAEERSPLSFQIMHFIYTHHEHIALQLRACFRSESEVEPIVPQKELEEMSMDNKIQIWGTGSEQDAQKFDLSDTFEGVLDEDDYLTLEADWSMAIENSRAYEWLISSIIKEASYDCDDSQQQTAMGQIRQQILSRLPTGKISPRRRPDNHTVTFKVSNALLTTFMEHQGGHVENSRQETLKDIIVAIFCSVDNIQLSTISQYMRQTWPCLEGDLEFFEIIRGLIGTKSTSPEMLTLGDSSTIEFVPRGFYSEFVITGTPISIAQFGEQLSWLMAAVQPAVSTLTLYARPFLRYFSDEKLISKRTHGWVVEVWWRPSDDLGVDFNSKNDWRSLLSSHVIIQGFPITIRPAVCPGLEAPSRMLVHLPPSAESYDCHNCVLLRDTKKVLSIRKITQGICVWYVSGSVDDKCPCEQRAQGPSHAVHATEFRQCRHIISDPPITRAALDLSKPVLTAIKAATARPVMEVCQSDYQPEPSEVVTHSGIPSDSLDSDMFSISEYSEGRELGTESIGEELTSILDVVASHLLTEYRVYMQQSCSDTNQHGSNQGGSRSTESKKSASNGSSSGPSTITRLSKSSGKRPARQADNGSDDEEQRGPKRKKLGTLDSRPRYFACPFWKRDPGKYRSCFGAQLDKICRVKQHLQRKHMPEYQCEKCLVVFPDSEHKERHLQNDQVACTYNSAERYDFVTSDQRSKLSHKSRSGFNNEQQWFAIWDILFSPVFLKPSSPFIDGDLSEELCSFREFSEGHSHAFLMEQLQAGGLVGPDAETENEIFRAAVNRAMTLLFDQWLANRASLADTELGRPLQGAKPREHRLERDQWSSGPCSTFVDNGVEVTSPPKRHNHPVHGSTIQPPVLMPREQNEAFFTPNPLDFASCDAPSITKSSQLTLENSSDLPLLGVSLDAQVNHSDDSLFDMATPILEQSSHLDEYLDTAWNDYFQGLGSGQMGE